MEINIVVPQKIDLCQNILEHIYKRYDILTQGHFLNYVYKSQKLETTEMFFNLRKDNANVVHLHNGLLLSSNHLERCNPEPERQMCPVLTYSWALTVK